MKMLAMHCDPQTALYYLELEDLIFRFFDNKQSEELMQYKQTIEQLKQSCVIYRINIYDEFGKKIEKQYVGSSTQKKKRLLAHYYDSSNPHVNHYIKIGRKVTYTILYQFEYLFKTERNAFEQRFIDKIPQDMSLNIKLVQLQQNHEVINIQEETEEQLLQQEITTIPEHQFTDLNQRERNTFENNVKALKNYIVVNKKYPNKRDTCEISKKVGYFVSDIRSRYTNKNLHISKEKIEYINEQIPGFVWSYKRDTFTTKADQLQEFYDTNKYWPRRNHKDADAYEISLGKFVAHVRESYNKIDIPDANVAYRLDEERLQYLYDILPDFVFSVDKEGKYTEIANQLNNYIEKNKTLPRRSGANREPEEVTLGSFIHNFQQSIKANRPTVPEIMQVLDQHCPLFDYKKVFKLTQ